MANLAEMLEGMAGRRMQAMPSIAPAAPSPVSAISPEQSPASSGLDSLLPLLLQNPKQGGMQNGMQGPGGNYGGTASDVEQMAKRWAMNRYNYSPEDWRKLDYIIENESGWNYQGPNALNESSGAAGLAQKISGYDSGYREGDPKSQLRWLFNYINSHPYQGYGTGIDAAYAHKQATGWY